MIYHMLTMNKEFLTLCLSSITKKEMKVTLLQNIKLLTSFIIYNLKSQYIYKLPFYKIDAYFIY